MVSLNVSPPVEKNVVAMHMVFIVKPDIEPQPVNQEQTSIAKVAQLEAELAAVKSRFHELNETLCTNTKDLKDRLTISNKKLIEKEDDIQQLYDRIRKLKQKKVLKELDEAAIQLQSERSQRSFMIENRALKKRISELEETLALRESALEAIQSECQQEIKSRKELLKFKNRITILGRKYSI